MEIKKFKKLKDNKYKVILDNDLEITLYDDVIVEYNLLSNKVMDEKKLTEITSRNDSLDSYYKSLRYLNTKLRSKLELEKYLSKTFDKGIVKSTLEKLEKEGYLNEEVYISAYVNDQINLTLNGYHKIYKDLKNLGLTEELILKKLDTIPNDVWQEKIEKIVTKKLRGNHTSSSAHFKKKLNNDLYNSGYSHDLITEMLSKLELEDDIEIVTKEGNKLLKKYSKKYESEKLDYTVRIKLLQKGFSSCMVEEFMAKKNTNY